MKKITFITQIALAAVVLTGTPVIYSGSENGIKLESQGFQRTGPNQYKIDLFSRISPIVTPIFESIGLGATAAAITYPLMRLSGRGSHKSRAAAFFAFGTAVAGKAITSFVKSHFNQLSQEESDDTALDEGLAKEYGEKKATYLGILASSVTLPLLAAKKGVTRKNACISLAAGFGTYLASLTWSQFSKNSAQPVRKKE